MRRASTAIKSGVVMRRRCRWLKGWLFPIDRKNSLRWTRFWMALTQIDERRGRVVEMKFFGGLSVEEIAEVLRVSPDTVKRDWKLAKAWLGRELRKTSRTRLVGE